MASHFVPTAYSMRLHDMTPPCHSLCPQDLGSEVSLRCPDSEADGLFTGCLVERRESGQALHDGMKACCNDTREPMGPPPQKDTLWVGEWVAERNSSTRCHGEHLHEQALIRTHRDADHPAASKTRRTLRRWSYDSKCDTASGAHCSLSTADFDYWMEAGTDATASIIHMLYT